MSDENTCLLCLEQDDVTKGKLFRPCRCSYIHEKCLEELRIHRSIYAHECSICKYKYRVSRVWFANLITNPITISVVTFAVIMLSVIIISWFIRFFVYFLIGVKLTHRAFALSGKIIWWSVLLIGFITILLAIYDDRENRIEIPNFGDHHFRIYDVRIYDDLIFFKYIRCIFEYIGYMLSLTGFVIFIKNIYNIVRMYSVVLLNKFGQRVLNVEIE